MTLSACDMDLVPSSSIAYSPVEPLIQTADNLTAFENGILSSFRSNLLGDFVVVDEVQLDGFNATIDYNNNYGAVHKTDDSFTSSDYSVTDHWTYVYQAIKNFNIMIEAADETPEELRDAAQPVKGEAYFFRAASYLDLAHHFGKAYGPSSSSDLCVPLVLKYDQNEKPSRATVAEVYSQIKSDLDNAATLLADATGEVRAQKPTIDAVNALYARYFIDVKDYKNAALYAHKVIDTGKYKLASTAEEMTAEYVNDNGKEAIMQMYASLTESTASITAFTRITAEKKNEFGFVLTPFYIPSKSLIDLYEADDLRLAAWFDNTMPVRISGVVHSGEFYVLSKYMGNPALSSTALKNGRTSPKPFKIGEMYLIAAEAYAADGQSALAKKDLNVLQAARGASLTDASEAKIRNEWAKETVAEGLRLPCLKRWGVGFSSRKGQDGATDVIFHGTYYDQKSLEASSNYFQWPIPVHDIQLNKNLVQNPGYGNL